MVRQQARLILQAALLVATGAWCAHGGTTVARQVPFDDYVLVLETDSLDCVTSITVKRGEQVLLQDASLAKWQSRGFYALSLYGYGRLTKTVDVVTVGTGTGWAIYHVNRYRLEDGKAPTFLFCRKVLECHAEGEAVLIDSSMDLRFTPGLTPFGALLRMGPEQRSGSNSQ